MSSFITRIEELEQRLEEYDDPENDEEERDSGAAGLVQILRDVCAVVREAEASDAANLRDIVEKAHGIINDGVKISYGINGEAYFDYMPSFAHSDATPLVKDSFNMPFAQGMVDTLLPFLRDVMAMIGNNAVPPPIPIPDLWDDNESPSEYTTRLSRFRRGIAVSAMNETPLAQMVYQARCEIIDDSICEPSRLVVSPGATCLAVNAAGGWKNRDPILHYYLLGSDNPLLKPITIDPGLSEVAHALAMDENKRLIFVGDSYRVKSFSWDNGTPTGCRIETGTLVHTLDSDGCDGAIAIMPNGRIARAGKGKVAVWDIEQLETHGPEKKLIGEGKFNAEDNSRGDDGEGIELSSGNKPHNAVKFEDVEFAPAAWHTHQPSGNILCGENGQRDNRYGCIALDLEHGGKIAARYIGHGGDVDRFSTSEGNPHVFATAGSDGFARLYDMRHPLPILTFDCGKRSDPCTDVVLIHPDGIPSLFTGGNTSQQIKMWDIRSRAAVYELSTGNNAIVSMAWDYAHSTLYAATECSYMDRFGRTYDYRRARIPKWAEYDPEEDASMDEEDDDDDEYDEEEDRCWPKKAYHGENFFGYCFDAGIHRIYGYVFKGEPDMTQLPTYGQATMGSSYW